MAVPTNFEIVDPAGLGGLVAEEEIPKPEYDAQLVPLQKIKNSNAEFTRAARDLNMVALTVEETNAVKTIGLYVQQMGGLNYAHGRAMVTQQTIAKWLNVLSAVEARTSSDETLIRCSQVAAMLIDKSLQNDKNTAHLLEIQQNEVAPQRARNKSFVPGGMAPVNLQVNVN